MEDLMLSVIKIHFALILQCYSYLAMNLNDINLTESQINEYFRQMQNESEAGEYDSKSDLQALIESTLHLEYEIFLSEEEQKYFKITLAQKECEVKRLKEKLTKKNGKVTALNENLKKLSKKIQEIKDGYKKINNQNKQCSMNEQTQRGQRLAFQQKKSILYKRYCELEQKYADILTQIDEYGEIQQQYNHVKNENEELQKQIQQFIDRKKQSNNDEAIDRKDHLKNQIKKLYEKIKMTEKEDENICQQYETNRKALNELQRAQNGINNKNFQIENLYHRIERLKEDIKNRRWQKNEKQKEYFELSHEQTSLRKEANAEMEYRNNQRKIREQLNHNFKIIDSEADEEIARTGEKIINHYQSCNLESQEQLDQLINRFQKIKGKSKNA